MKILVTGAAGFIGSRLTEALLTHGHDVTGIDNLTTGRKENFPDPTRLFIGDIRLKEQIPFADWDLIYHCAASYRDRSAWESDASTNVLGTINVIREAQRTHARLVYFQTALCYGPSPISPVRTDATLNPRGSYAVSKTAGETYIRDSGLDWVSFRLANIFGPRNLSGPIPTFFKRLDEMLPITIADSRRDFVFIDDLIWVAVNAATKGSGIYHVSSGKDFSISELYDAVVKAMPSDIRYEKPAISPRGPDDAATILLDPSGTEAEFGWKAQTSLEDGIKKAVDWYMEHGVTETYTHLAMNKNK